jgi:hypothetical protein
MQASEREQALLLLAHARADIDAVFALLNPPGIELPRGEAADACTHPKWHKTMGGHGWCPDCGARK